MISQLTTAPLRFHFTLQWMLTIFWLHFCNKLSREIHFGKSWGKYFYCLPLTIQTITQFWLNCLLYLVGRDIYSTRFISPDWSYFHRQFLSIKKSTTIIWIAILRLFFYLFGTDDRRWQGNWYFSALFYFRRCLMVRYFRYREDVNEIYEKLSRNNIDSLRKYLTCNSENSGLFDDDFTGRFLSTSGYGWRDHRSIFFAPLRSV